MRRSTSAVLGPVTLVFAALLAGCGPSRPPEPPAEPERGGAAGTSGAGASAGGAAPNGLMVAGDPGAQSGAQSSGREAPRPDMGSQAAVDPSSPCGAPLPAPRVRTSGSLVVESPPRAPTRTIPGRMRTQIDGSLSAGSQRLWVGPDVPSFVKIGAGTLELFLLDPVPVDRSSRQNDGFLAFYRDPFDASSCRLSGSDNCAYGATLYHCSGKVLWALSLNQFLSMPDHLEVQDVRYFDGTLYFNEACQSYSKEAGGKCSSLVAVDPVGRKVLWRTQPLTSNNVFLPTERYLISGYGFTAEPDFLFVVRRTDGAVVQRVSIPSAHEALSLQGNELVVNIYGKNPFRFRVEGFDGDKPRLVRLP